jgi:hypothetical protein
MCYAVVWQHVMWWCGSMLCGGVAACYAVVWQHVITFFFNFTECFNINTTLARLSTSSLMMDVYRNM